MKTIVPVMIRAETKPSGAYHAGHRRAGGSGGLTAAVPPVGTGATGSGGVLGVEAMGPA